MQDTFPTFEVRVPCPGRKVWPGEGGERIRYCSDVNSQMVEYGAFKLWVTLCDCRWSETGWGGQPRWQIIAEIVGEHYGPITSGYGTQRAWRCYSREYHWDLCDYCKSKQARTRSGGHQYCSNECEVVAEGRGCEVCGKEARQRVYVPHLRKAMPCYYHLANKITMRLGESCRKVGQAIYGQYCSRHCCSLAVASAVYREREERHKRKELKCVRNVRQLLGKTRKLFRERPSHEALDLLRREYELAATSQE